jgi:hypothetical protein
MTLVPVSRQQCAFPSTLIIAEMAFLVGCR